MYETNLQSSLSQFPYRHRRTFEIPGRVHLETRSLEPREREDFAARLETAFSRVPQVSAVRYHEPLGRVVVEHDGSLDAKFFSRMLQTVEQSLGVSRRPFSAARERTPGEVAPIGRSAFGLAVQSAAFTWGLLPRVGGFRVNHINLGVGVSLLRSVPGLRESLERRLGRPLAEMTMGGLSGFAKALNRAPLSAASELVGQALSFRERRARADTWQRREEALVGRPWVVRNGFDATRRVPLRDGSVDAYASKALSLSLLSFVGAMIFSNSSARAATLLFAGLPRPALRGRSAFTTELRRRLSSRHALVLRPEALEALDRVDVLLVDARALGDAGDRVEFVEALDDGLSRGAALGLLSEYLADSAPSHTHLAFTETSNDLGERFLWVRDGNDVVARARLGRRLAPETREFLDNALRCGVPVKVVDPTPEQTRVLDAMGIETVASDPDGAHVRSEQDDGSGVMLIAMPGAPGLFAADVGVVVQPADGPVDWDGDVLVPGSLDEAGLLVNALDSAKSVGKTSVWIARGEAVLSSLVNLGTPARIGLGRTFLASNLASLSAMLHGTLQAQQVPAPPPSFAPRAAWYAMPLEEVLRGLDTSAIGLSREEAMRRTPKDAESRHVAAKIAKYVGEELRNPLAPALMLGSGLSAVVGSTLDATLLASTLVFDAGWSVVQRVRADGAIRQLSSDSQLRCAVLRDGTLETVSPEALVDGDIIELSQGDVVPADARIIRSHGLEVDESPITGESMPVGKRNEPAPGMTAADRWSVVFQGSTVTAGTATAAVTARGRATHMHRLGINASSERAESKHSIRQQLRSRSWKNLPAAGVAAAATTLSGALRGRPLRSLLSSGASLTVAAIPEGLTLLTTIAETAAAKRLAKSGVRVRNPRALEALGRMSTLCLDKTGTLTRGQMSLECVATPDGRHSPDSAIGRAVIRLAAHTGVAADSDIDRLLHAELESEADVSPRAILPFSSRRGLAAAIIDQDGSRTLLIKGAPDRLLQDPKWRSAAIEHAERGARVLALVSAPWPGERREFEKAFDDLDLTTIDLQPQGLLVLHDEPREGARTELDAIRKAGVRTIMVTGDQAQTAAAVARTLGFSDEVVMTGPAVDAMSDSELENCIDSIDVFARIEPSQKTRIVGALQRRGESVGMTGDGANDAPALTLADVGIAFGEDATRAAKHSADLTIPGDLAGLSRAIEEGRALWVSVREAVGVLIGGNLGEILFSGATGVVTGRATLNARQLLLVNLFTDSLPAASIASAKPNKGSLSRLMVDGPRSISERELDQVVAWRALITSGAGTAAWTAARFTGTRARASTVALVSIVLSQLGQTVVATKGERGSLIACGLSAATLLALVETPGVSHALRCRPLGPLGLAQAGVTAAMATGASAWVASSPETVRDAPLRLAERVRDRVEEVVTDPHSRVGRLVRRARSWFGSDEPKPANEASASARTDQAQMTSDAGARPRA